MNASVQDTHKQHRIKTVLIGLVIVGLLATNAVTLKLYLDTFKVDEEEQIEDAAYEISQVKYFIQDWYTFMSSTYGKVKVYYNELQFNGGTYTLTVATDRIRAVYPKGERYQRLDNVTYVEFLQDNGELRCRLYYNETGEMIFRLD